MINTWYSFYLLVDGKWGPFGDYSTCSADCGGGKKKRTRKCNKPAPAFGGKNCVGSNEEEIPCNEQPCPGNTTNYIDIGIERESHTLLYGYEFFI